MPANAAKTTPASLARPKVRVTAPPSGYSHERQTGISDLSVVRAITFNATQTFDMKGRPTDHDNDR